MFYESALGGASWLGLLTRLLQELGFCQVPAILIVGLSSQANTLLAQMWHWLFLRTKTEAMVHMS